MRMMRRHDPQVQEDGFHWLLPRAAEFVEPLLTEYCHETDHGLRCWLLELIGEACDPRTLPVLLEALGSQDESLRYRAVRGLQLLGTPDARKALFDAGAETRATTPGRSIKLRRER
jgi:hypothetical protein